MVKPVVDIAFYSVGDFLIGLQTDYAVLLQLLIHATMSLKSQNQFGVWRQSIALLAGQFNQCWDPHSIANLNG